MLECALIYSDKYAQNLSLKYTHIFKTVIFWTKIYPQRLMEGREHLVESTRNWNHYSPTWNPLEVWMVLVICHKKPLVTKKWIHNTNIWSLSKTLVSKKLLGVDIELFVKSALWVQLSEVRLDTPSWRKLHKVKSRVLRRKHHLWTSYRCWFLDWKWKKTWFDIVTNCSHLPSLLLQSTKVPS